MGMEEGEGRVCRWRVCRVGCFGLGGRFGVVFLFLRVYDDDDDDGGDGLDCGELVAC